MFDKLFHFAEVKYNGEINKKVVDETLVTLNIDKLGLDENDRKYLKVLTSSVNGKGVGIDTIAASISQ